MDASSRHLCIIKQRGFMCSSQESKHASVDILEWLPTKQFMQGHASQEPQDLCQKKSRSTGSMICRPAHHRKPQIHPLPNNLVPSSSWLLFTCFSPVSVFIHINGINPAITNAKPVSSLPPLTCRLEPQRQGSRLSMPGPTGWWQSLSGQHLPAQNEGVAVYEFEIPEVLAFPQHASHFPAVPPSLAVSSIIQFARESWNPMPSM
jgi:hypothetical protein